MYLSAVCVCVCVCVQVKCSILMRGFKSAGGAAGSEGVDGWIRGGRGDLGEGGVRG